MLEIFETHAHYHAEQFNEDRDAILIAMHEGFLKPIKENAAGADGSDHRAAGNEADCAARTDGTGCTAGQDETAQPPDCEKTYRIQKIVDIAAEKDSLDPVMELTRRYDFVYGAIGLHPDEIGDLDDETERYMESCLTDPKIVAVGEIGIDYYWNKEARDVQIAGFERQIDMAVRHGLPVIVHSREAAEDTMSVVRANANSLQAAGVCPGIIHCYSYSVEHARMYADMGFMLGIGGVVTYKNAKKTERSREGDPALSPCAGDRLPVPCADAIPGKTERFQAARLCGGGHRGAQGDLRGRGRAGDGGKRGETVFYAARKTLKKGCC